MLIVNVIARAHSLLNETVLFDHTNISLLVLLLFLALTQQSWIRALDSKFKICSKKLTNFRICYKALTLLPNQSAFSMDPNWSCRFSPQS
jgi:hypothetical protein